MLYNGKVSLFIDYQFPLENQKCCTDAIDIFSGKFDNYDLAYHRMLEIMPANFTLDDGWAWSEWTGKEMAENPDIFTQYVAYTDDDRYFLAVLRPVDEEGES